MFLPRFLPQNVSIQTALASGRVGFGRLKSTYRFARFVKLVHANLDEAKCWVWDKSSVIAPQDLNDFARILHAKVKADFGLDDFGALEKVAEYNHRFGSNLDQQITWKSVLAGRKKRSQPWSAVGQNPRCCFSGSAR
jgi:hypothetical protein